MPTDPSPRIGLRAIDGADPADTIDTTDQAQVALLDAQMPIFSQGGLGARPVSTPAEPGKPGRLYYSTDNGLLYYDYGTGWRITNAPRFDAYADPLIAASTTTPPAGQGGPELTVPLTGLYRVEFGCYASSLHWTSGGMIVYRNGTSDVSAGAAFRNAGVNSTDGRTLMRRAERSLNAGDVLEARYTSGSGAPGTISYSYRWLSLTMVG
jgi:hypothetical protein